MKGTLIAPVLRSTRLVLRAMDFGDLSEVHRLRSDKGIARNMGFTAHENLERTRSYMQSMLNGEDADEWLFWVLTREKEDRFMGSIVLWNYREEHNDAELGYSLLPEQQGRGYMREALPVVMEFAYDALQIATLQVFTGQDNRPSRRLLEHLHFYYAANATEEMPNGKTMYLANYTMTKEEYYARKTAQHSTHPRR